MTIPVLALLENECALAHCLRGHARIFPHRYRQSRPPRLGGSGLFDHVRNASSAKDGPCFPVFTRAFCHRPDRGPSQDAAAVQPFHEYDCQFLLFTYVAEALLWKGDQWRVPSHSERAQIMGISPLVMQWAPKGDSSSQRSLSERVRCPLLGNAFHVPSCMLALIMLFKLCPQASSIPPAAYVGLEKHVRCQAKDTVWQPGLVNSFLGVLTWQFLEPLAKPCFRLGLTCLSCQATRPQHSVSTLAGVLRGHPVAPPQQREVGMSRRAVGVQDTANPSSRIGKGSPYAVRCVPPQSLRQPRTNW